MAEGVPAAGSGRGKGGLPPSPYEDQWRQPKNPGNILKLGLSNFQEQFGGLMEQVAELVPPDTSYRLAPDKFRFTLDDAKVNERERLMGPPGPQDPHPVIQLGYDFLVKTLDLFFAGRPLERFWLLETVARMPYFSYVTVLHFYETLGLWRTGELRQVHNAQEWNELHHLLIMESLGGNRRWYVRFIGYHGAIVYYWFLVLLYMVSPQMSYKFSEMLETHAVNTYTQFYEENEKKLKRLPPPEVAVEYYVNSDKSLFDYGTLMTRGNQPLRRPPCESLYDTFRNIADDEWEHVKTMVCCQDYGQLEELGIGTESVDEDDLDADPRVRFAKENRKSWNKWAEAVNSFSDQATEVGVAEGAGGAPGDAAGADDGA